MKLYNKNPGINPADIIDRDWVLRKAQQALDAIPRYITEFIPPRPTGGINDYHSDSDYWWSNPDTADGFPYIRRDGETNPDAFFQHRLILREMRTATAHLAAAYKLTGDEKYARKAAVYLNGFFLDEKTKMNPHLLYSQAIPGISTGRGIGVIDTLHLTEVPFAVSALENSPYMTNQLIRGLKKWFNDYLCWMTTHEYGIKEMNEKNNHAVCWFVQATSFALFTQNTGILEFCRERFKNHIIPTQMGINGEFPAELGRTKPYGYSIFVLDNFLILCHMLSTEQDDLWEFTLKDGRGAKIATEFLYPYLRDKSSWRYAPDVEHFDSWPVAVASLLFAGIGLGEPKYIELWKELDPDPSDMEVRRNMTIRQPLLWL